MAGTILQESLARFLNSHWHKCSTVVGIILKQWLARFFNSYWHECSTVSGTILQQWLAQFFKSRWRNCSTVTGMILQNLLAQLFNSHWHDYLTVTGMIVQQSLAWFFNSLTDKVFLFSMLAKFFNSDVRCWRIVPCTRNTTHDPLYYFCLASFPESWVSYFFFRVVTEKNLLSKLLRSQCQNILLHKP